MNTCGFVPFPGNGAYGHWSCERRRWHFGSHRFVNYTIARVPRVWRVKRLAQSRRSSRRLRKVGASPDIDYRLILYPPSYRPVPYMRSS